MKATSSITKMNKDRIALNIVTDNMQSLVFLTRIEFIELMAHIIGQLPNKVEEELKWLKSLKRKCNQKRNLWNQLRFLVFDL